MMYRILLSLLSPVLLADRMQAQQHRLTRLDVTWLDGNDRVTRGDGEKGRSWLVRDSKITPERAGGYCFFRVRQDGMRHYLQRPIARTCIEKIPGPAASSARFVSSRSCRCRAQPGTAGHAG